MPLVSICIPTYNHGKFLRDSLGSAVAQTYEHLEILVLDNASEDDTGTIVTEFSARDSRIRYLRHPENIGMIENLDACIRFANGRYIKLLCADDALEPDCVSAMAKVLDEELSVSLVGCARIVTDANLSPLRARRVRDHRASIPGPKMIAECFFLGNLIGEPTAVMFRRSDSLRGFSCSYHQLVDMEMWFHLLQMGDFFALPEALCRIRAHADQATWANDQDGRIVADRKRLYSEFAASAGLSAGLVRKCLWDFRMAYAVVRSESAGYRLPSSAMAEVFFQRAFPSFTRPAVKLLTTLGLGRLWRAWMGQRQGS
jgi:glycosyltransferase involved in cell wall biosynthesis